MIEKIENKLAGFVANILSKEVISYSEYKILVDYLGRLKSAEAAEKWEQDKESRNLALQSIFTLMNK